MKKGDDHGGGRNAGIPCVEVLVKRLPASAPSSYNLRWTLAAYALENQPVQKNLEIQHSDVFHFMCFDWERSVRKILDEHKVSYSIVQRFFVQSLHEPAVVADVPPADQIVWLEAADSVLPAEENSWHEEEPIAR